MFSFLSTVDSLLNNVNGNCVIFSHPPSLQLNLNCQHSNPVNERPAVLPSILPAPRPSPPPAALMPPCRPNFRYPLHTANVRQPSRPPSSPHPTPPDPSHPLTQREPGRFCESMKCLYQQASGYPGAAPRYFPTVRERKAASQMEPCSLHSAPPPLGLGYHLGHSLELTGGTRWGGLGRSTRW